MSCRAFARELRRVAWPPRFKPELPLRYDGTLATTEFLQCHALSILAAGGDDRAMANWLTMAFTGVPCAWLMSLPESSVATWEEMSSLFIACFVAPAPHAVAALREGSQAPASGCHVKQFFRQVGSAHVQRGVPPGWAAPMADLTFDSRDHPATMASAGALLMLGTPTI